MKLSLRNRFLLPTLGLIIAGMACLTVITFVKSRSALTLSIKEQIELLGNSTGAVVNAWMKDRTKEVVYWASEKTYESVLTSADKAAAMQAADTRLAALKKDLGYYENICVSDLTGQVIAASDPNGKIKVPDRDYFKEALQGRVFISDSVKSKVTGQPVCVIASPMRDGQKITGVFFAVLDLGWFTAKFIDPVKVGTRGHAFLASKEGKFLSHPDKALILTQDLKSMDGMGGLLDKSNDFMEFTSKGEEYLAACRKDKDLGWLLVVMAPRSEMMAPVKDLGYINLAVGVAVVLAAIVVILFLVSSLIKPLRRAIEGLSEASEQVETGATEVAQSSQQLADGSSQQAAALEESSSSLEEMTSMTRQNADNAGQANVLMKESIRVIGAANASMQQLTTSMHEISEASEETSKIIKTIDEIAFQTNLLALNAAVEAARAGEAGAGFAVVADEVRNLALRAAEAARNTADLIEKTVRKVHDGGSLVDRTNTAFVEVAGTSSKVDELLEEIAAASREQAHGIEQVNRAVAEMDKVTQQTAAIAEESSSASEEMSAQAAEMKVLVGQLVELMGERNGSGTKAKPGTRGAGRISTVARVFSKKRASGEGKAPAIQERRAVRALPGKAAGPAPSKSEPHAFKKDDDF